MNSEDNSDCRLCIFMLGPYNKSQTKERKPKVVAAGWGTYLNAALAIKRQGRFEERFLQEHLVWEVGGLVWCEPADHPSFFQSIHSAKKSFFYSSYFSNHHGAKWLMRPTSSKDLCLPFCLILILWLDLAEGWARLAWGYSRYHQQSSHCTSP